ncbi:glycosyltransferase family 2 protein [Pseudotamlana agarivorans]|uniref:glycosyltransferase family 2 protein n=1 Tax=Pseudotamlana agarivorans TaxID=481183 RepID=UPI000834BBE1|nr:glycosyltransferase family 2 protein [Tamlana agarivorans]
MTPYFSVVIPLYNKEKYIEATLLSVFNQTFKNFEIIIINDGSQDNSIAIVQTLNDPRIKLYSIENQGVSFARNLGIKNASSNYIALLDADDQWYPNHLQTMHDLIVDFPNKGLYCSRYEFVFKNKIAKKSKLKDIPELYRGPITDFFSSNLFDPIIHTSAAVIPKHIFSEVNFFDTNLKSGQDTYLWIQIALKHDIVISNAISSKFVKYANSLSKSQHTKGRIFILDKFKKQEENNSAFHKYMDMNRYAMALDYKLHNQQALSHSIYKAINKKNLNSKQKWLYGLPSIFIKHLYKLKNSLDHMGVFFHLYR